MKLLKISYKDANWELKDLELGDLNLIVAKNATGKSRIIRLISILRRIFVGFEKELVGSNVNLQFEFINNNNDNIKYGFEYVDAEYCSEYLLINEDEVLTRIVAEKAILKHKDVVVEVNPPLNKLVLLTNRDLKKYPFFEEIIEWADNSYGFLFSNIKPQNSHTIEDFNFDIVGGIPDKYVELKEIEKQNVILLLNETGYKVNGITYEDWGYTNLLRISEEDSIVSISHFDLSQGMYRDLSLIIYLVYLISQRKPATILIDDLCEGLDYERSTKLGKLVFDKCRDSNIQLIATSNDSFLMDVVDIKYWNLLQRKGNVVTTINNKNNPKIFSDFRFTGLSNFDLLSSDFINNGGKWSK